MHPGRSTPPPTPDGHATAYGALLGGLGVALGAFGAHTLREQVTPAMLEVFETGVKYQMFHAAALLALGAHRGQRRAPAWLLAGTLVFSFSLYALVLTGARWLGAVTPIGGALMIIGWFVVFIDARRLAATR